MLTPRSTPRFRPFRAKMANLPYFSLLRAGNRIEVGRLTIAARQSCFPTILSCRGLTQLILLGSCGEVNNIGGTSAWWIVLREAKTSKASRRSGSNGGALFGGAANG